MTGPSGRARVPRVSWRRPWHGCVTLADVAALTAEWLEGGTPGQPGYGRCGPDPETGPLTAVLAAANRAGYLTDCSQPGSDETGSDGLRWRQRAAVSGYAADPAAARLIELARRSGELAVLIHRAPRWRNRYGRCVTVTTRAGQPYTRFGAEVSRRQLRDREFGYGTCGRAAVAEIQDAWQVTITDTTWRPEPSPVWAVLAEFAGPGRHREGGPS